MTIFEQIEEKFFAALDAKTGWGKNEIKSLYTATQRNVLANLYETNNLVIRSEKVQTLAGKRMSLNTVSLEELAERGIDVDLSEENSEENSEDGVPW